MEARSFELKTPFLKQGSTHNILAKTDVMNIALKYYCEGGEVTLHTHPSEDHAFIILEGQITFTDKEGKTTVLNRGQGMLVPAGLYYSFRSSGEGPVVMLRFGASTKAKLESLRIGIDGAPAVFGGKETVPIEGSYWSL